MKIAIILMLISSVLCSWPIDARSDEKCSMGLVSVPIKQVVDAAKALDGSDRKDLEPFLPNPLSAALLLYSGGLDEDRKKVILSSLESTMLEYKLSAEVFFSEIMSGGFRSVSKREEILNLLQKNWAFAREGVAISTILNSNNKNSLEYAQSVLTEGAVSQNYEYLYYLGLSFEKQKSKDLAFSYYKNAAAGGVRKAQLRLAEFYIEGKCNIYGKLLKLVASRSRSAGDQK